LLVVMLRSYLERMSNDVDVKVQDSFARQAGDFCASLARTNIQTFERKLRLRDISLRHSYKEL